MMRRSARASGALVVGVMSGTSADGIDVALVCITESGAPRISAQIAGFYSTSYPARVRHAILRIANIGATDSAEISRLDFLLGELYAKAILAALKKFRISPAKVSLAGVHGQTIYHQGARQEFLGAGKSSCTLQIGDSAVVAARTGINTVGGFRPADIAAGGQGAPLVPFVDYLVYRNAHRGRVTLNIGGIANFTVIPAGAASNRVIAFDTGPGNMIVDALVRHFSRGRSSYDRDAKLARAGELAPQLLLKLLAHPYLQLRAAQNRRPRAVRRFLHAQTHRMGPPQQSARQ